MTLDEAQTTLTERLRGTAGYVGTGQDHASGQPRLVAYVGADWQPPPNWQPKIGPFEVAVVHVGKVRPL